MPGRPCRDLSLPELRPAAPFGTQPRPPKWVLLWPLEDGSLPANELSPTKRIPHRMAIHAAGGPAARLRFPKPTSTSCAGAHPVNMWGRNEMRTTHVGQR